MLKYVPPIFLSWFLRSVRRFSGFSGPYRSWEDALGKGQGYNNQEIASEIEWAVSNERSLEISNREAKLGLAVLAAFNELGCPSSLRILDLGGGGGRHFNLIRFLLSSETKIEYEIVETEVVVERFASKSRLIKYSSAFPTQKVDVFIASGALQYLEQPVSAWQWMASKAKFVVLDRLSVHEGDTNVIFRQNVFKGSTNRHSYPCWFFSRNFVENHKNFKVVLEWKVPEDSPWIFGGRQPYAGYLFRNKNK